MGIGLRIMPGVRISASSRGIRAGVGPRVARVHAGSGGVGFSSGAGPLTVYTGALGSKRRSSSRTSLAAYERQLRAAEREQEIHEVFQMEQRLISAHLEDFPRTLRPKVQSLGAVDEKPFFRRREAEALAGISLFQRSQRRAARAAAAEIARQDIESEKARLREAEEGEQQHLDAWWGRLNGNDPETVVAALETAFADNEAPAAPLDCKGDHVTVVLMYPSPTIVPERKPAVTPGGKPTLHKRNKTERNGLYLRSLASAILVTVKEALAVAPGINQVTTLVLRREQPDPTTRPLLEVIYCGTFDRSRFRRLNWPQLDPVSEIEYPSDHLIERRGRTNEIAALDLDDEADIATVLKQTAVALNCDVAPDALARGEAIALQGAEKGSEPRGRDMSGAPEALEGVSFSIWQKHRERLGVEIAQERDQAVLFEKLLVVTNVINAQYTDVQEKLNEFAQTIEAISTPDDPRLPGVREFIDWADQWLEEMQAEFDDHRERRDRLRAELSPPEVTRAETGMAEEFEVIKEEIRTTLHAQIQALQEGSSLDQPSVTQERVTAPQPSTPPPPQALPPANWYPDPNRQARLRYWDGSQWTEHTAD